MNGTPGRIGGVVLGLVIVLVGYSLFNPQTGVPQTPATVALSSVLVALGIGAIGAALMPGTLTINGKDATPLKLSGTATGGAAFFIATLVFLYATKGIEPGHDIGPGPVATGTMSIASSGPSPGPTAPASPEQSAVPAPPPKSQSPSPPNGDDPDDPPGIANNPDTYSPQGGPAQQGMARAHTFCSACCPQGPQGCRYTGFGFAPTYQQAAEIAVRYCMASGGHADTCFANVTQY